MFCKKNSARAESILNAAIDANTPSQTLGQRLAWCARAELALSRKEPSQALQIIEQIMTSGAHSSESRDIPRLARLRGEALTALNRASEAEEILEHARKTAQQQEALPLLWRMHLALGKCYQTQRRYEAAEESLLAARDIIEQLATQCARRVAALRFPGTYTFSAFYHVSITPACCEAGL